MIMDFYVDVRFSTSDTEKFNPFPYRALVENVSHAEEAEVYILDHLGTLAEAYGVELIEAGTIYISPYDPEKHNHLLNITA